MSNLQLLSTTLTWWCACQTRARCSGWEKGSVVGSLTRAVLEGANHERAVRVVTPLYGAGLSMGFHPSLSRLVSRSSQAWATPGNWACRCSFLVFFYHLLWKPAAHLIDGSSKLNQTCFPQHNHLLHGAQFGEPQVCGRKMRYREKELSH